MKLAQKMKLFLISGKSRWILLGGLVLIGVCLLVPNVSPAQAFWEYSNPITWLSALVMGLLKLLLLLADNLMQLIIWLVNWAIRNPFGISYTRPGLQAPDNFIIEIGWTLLRDLVNMGFILGLVYIGLATALDFNIKNKFTTGKTFFNLILIALIVNFTPAICGAVVDMGNILGSFFTQSADFQTIHTIFEKASKDISKDWKNILTQGTLLLQTVLLIGFGFGASLILGIYAILFFVRGPIIWILVILSPVAFFAYIFEETKKGFKQWWDIFIQWALMMPVVLGFFLYLSQQILIRANEIMNMTGAGGEGFGGFLNKVLPYTLPLLFLAGGLIIGAGKLMPAGGGAIIGAAKAGGLAVAGAAGAGAAWAGKKTASGASNLWQRKRQPPPKPGDDNYETWKNKSAFTKTSAGLRTAGRYMFGGETDTEKKDWESTRSGRWTRRVASRIGGVGAGAVIGGTVGGGPLGALIGAGAGAVLGSSRVAGILGRKATGRVKVAIEESADQELAEATKKMRGKSITAKENAINNALPGIIGRKKRLSAMVAAIEDGDDLSDFKTLTRYKKKDIIKDAIKYAPGKMSAIKNIDPELTAEVVGKKGMKLSTRAQKQMGIDMSDDDKAKYQTREYKDEKTGETKTLDPLAVKLMAEIKANKMNAWTDDIAKKAVETNIANDFWDGTRIGKAAELFGSKFVNKFREGIKTEDYYTEKIKQGELEVERNPIMAKYLESQGAAALGVGFKEKTPDRPDLMHLIDTENFDRAVGIRETQINPATGANYTLNEAKEAVRLDMTTEQARKIGTEDFSKIDFDNLLNIDPAVDPLAVKATAAILLGADRGKLKKVGETASATQKQAIKNMVTPPAGYVPGNPATYGPDSAFRWLVEQAALSPAKQAKIQDIVSAIHGDPNFQ